MLHILDNLLGWLRSTPATIVRTIDIPQFGLTSLIFCVFSAVIFFKASTDGYITCDIGTNQLNLEHVQSYCWNQGIWIVNKHVEPVEYLCPLYFRDNTTHTADRTSKTHLSNLHFIFLLCGVLTSIPIFMWKHSEAGLAKHTAGLLSVNNSEERKQNNDRIVKFILRNPNVLKMYFRKYWLCKGVAVLASAGIFYILEINLENQFLQLGVNFVSGGNQLDLDTMFPSMPSCTYCKAGPSGSVFPLDIYCHIPASRNMRFMVTFLWFWNAASVVLFFVSSVFEYGLYVFPCTRDCIWAGTSTTFSSWKIEVKFSRVGSAPVLFFVSQIERNINVIDFHDFIAALNLEICKKLPRKLVKEV